MRYRVNTSRIKMDRLAANISPGAGLSGRSITVRRWAFSTCRHQSSRGRSTCSTHLCHPAPRTALDTHSSEETRTSRSHPELTISTCIAQTEPSLHANRSKTAAGQYLSLNMNGSPSSTPKAVPITLSYTAVGGSPSAAPSFTFMQNGTEQTVALTTTPTVYDVDQGTLWNVTGILASGSNERWITNQNVSGNATSQTVNFVYYHQFLLSFSGTVQGGGSGYQAAQLSYVSSGTTLSGAISNTVSSYWADAGSSWSVPSTLSGSSSSERWITNQSTSGAATSPQSVNLNYYHQFQLSFNYLVNGGGSGYRSSCFVLRVFRSRLSQLHCLIQSHRTGLTLARRGVCLPRFQAHLQARDG